jgi:hypothetical protein
MGCGFCGGGGPSPPYGLSRKLAGVVGGGWRFKGESDLATPNAGNPNLKGGIITGGWSDLLARQRHQRERRILRNNNNVMTNFEQVNLE